MPTTEPTIAQRLQAAGYSYQTDRKAHDGRVILSKGGEVVGRFDVFEAIDLLRAEGR